MKDAAFAGITSFAALAPCCGCGAGEYLAGRLDDLCSQILNLNFLVVFGGEGRSSAKQVEGACP